MPARITSLTEEQKSQFGPWAEKWIAWGLSTDRMDLAYWEEGARRCYEFANIPWPGRVVRVGSPQVGALAASIADRILSGEGGGGKAPRRSPPSPEVVAAVGAATGLSGDALEKAIRRACGSALAWHYWIGGSLWASWHAYVSFYLDVCDWTPEGDIEARARAYTQAAHCGYWWPNSRFVLVCDRPTRISRDAQGRLHHESGKAIEWADGWGVYSWHGVTVPERVILDPSSLTVEEIEGARNAEVRRVMLERYGYERYILEAGADLIHTDDCGALYRRQIPGDDEPLVMVHVANSTPEHDGSRRKFMLRVAPDLRPLPPGDWPRERQIEWFEKQKPQEMTARNAVASTFHRRGEDYSPALET